jgi:TonB family protein
MKPWHLKASFQLSDSAGKITDQGSLEEFWAGAHKWKRIYTSAGITQTTFNTDQGTFELGESEPRPLLLGQLSNGWLTPLPTEAQIGIFNFSTKPLEMGAVKLTCVIGTPKQGEPLAARMDCFSTDKPALRMSMGPASVSPAGGPVLQMIYNKTTLFQGRFVASSLTVKSSAGDSISGHIDSLELLPTVDDASFIPPPEAKLVPKLVSISGNVAAGFLLRQVTPDWPSAAKDAGMSGTVVIEAIITKDGHIRDAKAVSGPKVFQGVALEAVRHWLYRPYLLNGEPVEVETTINVVFGRPQQ